MKKSFLEIQQSKKRSFKPTDLNVLKILLPYMMHARAYQCFKISLLLCFSLLHITKVGGENANHDFTSTYNEITKLIIKQNENIYIDQLISITLKYASFQEMIPNLILSLPTQYKANLLASFGQLTDEKKYLILTLILEPAVEHADVNEFLHSAIPILTDEKSRNEIMQLYQQKKAHLEYPKQQLALVAQLEKATTQFNSKNQDPLSPDELAKQLEDLTLLYRKLIDSAKILEKKPTQELFATGTKVETQKQEDDIQQKPLSFRNN